MADLTFKRGLLSALGKQTVSDGTIYVTTDEGAMYVDVGNQRIRLGDFIPVNTLSDLQNQHPLYETAVYYVKQGNILARYDSVGQKWIQINKAGVVSVTEDSNNAQGANVITGISIDTNANGELSLVLTRETIDTSSSFEQVNHDIGDLADRLDIIESSDVTQAGSIAKAVNDARTALLGSPQQYTTIAALETALNTVSGVASGAASQASTNAGNISQLQTDVSDLEDIVGATANDGLRKAVADNTSAIELLNDSDATTVGSVKYAAAQAVAAVVANADASYDTLKEIADWILNDTTGAAKMASDISQATTDIESLSDRLDDIDGNNGSIAGLDSRLDTVEDTLDALTADENTQGSIDYKIAQLQSSIEQNADDISNLDDRLDDVEAAIETINGDSSTAGSIAAAVAAEATLRAAEDTRLAGLISTNAGNITTHTSQISQLQTDVGTLQDALTWVQFT